jgi:hypothetical protein
MRISDKIAPRDDQLSSKNALFAIVPPASALLNLDD